MFKEMQLFKKTAMGILATFMGMMVFVTIIAYARPSGSTRQDMATAHILRLKAAEAKVIAERTPQANAKAQQGTHSDN